MLSSLKRIVPVAFVFLSVVKARSLTTRAGLGMESSIGSLEPRSVAKTLHSTNNQRSFDSLPLLGGVNVAGLEFGIGINGETSGSGNVPPPMDQIVHFLDSGMNVIRIPFGWQYIQPTIKGPLDATLLANLEKCVNAVLERQAFPIIDLHNYARRDGQIVGESALGADALVDLWTKLAQHFHDRENVILGLMNEPHDLNSNTWIATVQKVITAIRGTDSRHQIVIPGNNWSHLSTFAQDYNAGMSTIKNPDGTHNGLVFEIHQYFDSDGSGQSKECSQNHVDELASVAALLKKDGRQAIITEFGGGSSESCEKIFNEFIKAVNSNYPAFTGLVAWGAGSFQADYPLVLTIKKGNTWEDQPNLLAMKAAGLGGAAGQTSY